MYYNSRTAITAYGQQQQQQGNTGFRPMRQSPALQSPLPEFKSPVGARGQDIMIIWDFQNVRTPTELEPVDVIRFLYNTFVMQPGPRRCAGAFCTFTDNTKKAVGEKRFNQFCSNGVLNFMMINSPGGPRKADDSDHPLKEMMMNFTVDCVRGGKDGVLLLITADADFVRPAIWCKQQGCVALELLYYGPIASKEIRQLEANWKMEWRDFLDCSVGRRCAWTFPYPQDIAAGLVPPGTSSSSSSSVGMTSSSSYGEREQRLPLQQQHQVIAGYLPAPAQRLRLTAPAGATGSTGSTPSGATAASPAAAAAVQVSNAHVQQAAQQLLQNPAALHQVVQQYKQSMQTTAVLQQVLQGVAQAAGGSTGAAPAAAAAAAGGSMHVPSRHSAATATGAAAAAAAGATYASGYPRSGHVPVPQRHHQSSSSNAANLNGPYSTTASKQTAPVQLFSRPASADTVLSATSMKSPVGAAADSSSSSSSGLTWQQLEQQQGGNSSSTAVRGGTGFWDGSPNMSKSPPAPEWWDGSSSGKLANNKPKAGFTSSMPCVAGPGVRMAGAEGLGGSRTWAAKTTKYKPDGWAEEEQEEGFWDAPVTEQQQQQSGPNGSNSQSRSQTPNHFMSSSNAAGNGCADQQQSAAGTGTGFHAAGAAAAAAAGGAGLPPTPSTGLLKRAGSAVGSTATAAAAGSARSGSGEALAALLAGAAAKTGGSNTSGSSPGRQQSHHRHTVGGNGGSNALQQLHHQLSAGAERHRTPSPALPGGRQQEVAYDRHQQHHELQIAMAQRQQLAREASSSTRDVPTQDSGSSSHEIDRELRLALMQQRLQEKEAVAAKSSASANGTDGSSSARQDPPSLQELDREVKLALMQQRLQAKEAAAAAAREAAAAACEVASGSGAAGTSSNNTTTPTDHLDSVSAESAGALSKSRRTSGPELAAAARLFTRATAEAVATTSHAVPTAAASAGQELLTHATAQQQQGQQQRHGGVVVVQAPPAPHWLMPEQQQQQQLDVDESSRSGASALAAPSTPQGADAVSSMQEHEEAAQQQQQQEDDYLIDDETGEVIILRPRFATAGAALSTAAVIDDGAAHAAPEQLLLFDGCTADGSSSTDSLLEPVMTDVMTDVMAGAATAVEDARQTDSLGGRMMELPVAEQEDKTAAFARQQQQQLISIGLQVCDAPKQMQQQPVVDLALEHGTENMQEQLVRLHLSVAGQQQHDKETPPAAAAAHVVSTSDLHQSQVGDSDDGGTAVQLAHEELPLRPLDAQVSAAAAIAAAALAATAEDLLNELPGADPDLVDQAGFIRCDQLGLRPEDQAEFGPDGFAAQSEPLSSEPEPPSPGPYTPLSPADSSADQENSEGLGPACFEGEGLSCDPLGVEPHLAEGQQSADNDFVSKLVRRLSSGITEPDFNLDLNLGLHARDADTNSAATAACSAAAAEVLSVPPVLLDLGMPLAGVDTGSIAWVGPRHIAGSPVTAIEELGNVSSSSSEHGSAGACGSSSEHGSAGACGSSSGRRSKNGAGSSDSGSSSSSDDGQVAGAAPAAEAAVAATAAVAEGADSAIAAAVAAPVDTSAVGADSAVKQS